MFCFSENEDSVALICEKVKANHLTSSNWGGGLWKNLKSGKIDSPGWDRLKTVDFWHPEKGYRAVHTQLSGKKIESKMLLTQAISAPSCKTP